MGRKRRELMAQQAKEKKAEKMKLAIGVAVVVAAGGGVIGYAVHKNNQELYGPYCKVGDHEISRLEWDFFYNSSVNNFLSMYQPYLEYIGLDTDKDFSEQQYSEDKTWEQFFEEEAFTLMQEVYILSDAAKEAGYKSDGKSYEAFMDDVNEKSKELGMTSEQYIKGMYGNKATKKNIAKILKNYYTAADYAGELQEKTFVPTDKELEDYYQEHREDFDKVTYRMFQINADPSKLGEKTEPAPVESTEETTETTETESSEVQSSEVAESTEVAAESTEEAASSEEAPASETATETVEEVEDAETPNAENADGNETSAETPAEDGELTNDVQVVYDGDTATYSEEQWAEAMKVAEEKATEFYEQVYDEETFKELCIKYAETDEMKEAYKNDDASLYKNETKDYMRSAISDWLMDESRVTNHTAIIKDNDNNCYYIVFFMGRIRDDSPSRDVRHILIQPEPVDEIDENADAAAKIEHEKQHEEADAAAKAEAERILKEWQDGEATEESFAKLADEHSMDSAEGGLYEGVSRGDMVPEFEDWLFDEARKPGDTGIVESMYGYHIMYMVGDNQPSWKLNARMQVVADKYSDFIASKLNDYLFEDIKGELTYLVGYGGKQEESTEEVSTQESTSEEATSESSEAPVESTTEESKVETSKDISTEAGETESAEGEASEDSSAEETTEAPADSKTNN